MAKDIQIKYINENEEWEELYPATKAHLVSNNTGETLSTLLSEKANKNEVYTRVEVDNLMAGIDTFDLPVTETEPTDTNLWFQIL